MYHEGLMLTTHTCTSDKIQEWGCWQQNWFSSSCPMSFFHVLLLSLAVSSRAFAENDSDKPDQTKASSRLGDKDSEVVFVFFPLRESNMLIRCLACDISSPTTVFPLAICLLTVVAYLGLFTVPYTADGRTTIHVVR